MKKFIITEEESKKIKQMYGILFEQYYYFYGDTGEFTDTEGKQNKRIYITNVSGVWSAYIDFPGKESNQLPKPDFEVPTYEQLGIKFQSGEPKFIPNEALSTAEQIFSSITGGLRNKELGNPFIFIDTDNIPKVGNIKKMGVPLDTVSGMDEVKLKENSTITLNQYYVNKNKLTDEKFANYWVITNKKEGDKKEDKI